MHSRPTRSHSPYSNPEKIIGVYRGWQAFEQANGGPQIIDFDLTEITEIVPFNSRTAVLSALEDLREQLTDNSAGAEFLRDKLLGSIFYLRALLGQQIPFGDYVEHTLGISVEPFPEYELAKAKNRLNGLLSSFGIELKSEHKEEFEKRLTIHDPEKIKQGITAPQKFWLARLRDKGIPTADELDLKTEFVKIDAYWNNWITGSLAEGIKLLINIHPRKKYDLGRPLMLCLHEICGHAVQMTLWKNLIAQGTINPACGLTTVHSPEAFVCEALGQSVADFLGEEGDFPDEFWLSRWLQYYTLMILHNAHLMIYEGAPIVEILDYALGKLPFSSPIAVEAEIRDRGTNPLYRIYQLTYALGEHTIRHLSKDFTSQQRQLFLSKMYALPMTPTQLERLARDIANS